MAENRLKSKTLKVNGFLEEMEKDELRGRVDIVSLFNEFGVKLSRKGKGFMGQCPWHDDKDPSLSVDRDKGLYNCFGCGESGDMFTLVEKMKGLGFKEALTFLRERVGNFTPQAEPVPQPSKQVHSEITLDTIADHYHKKLFESKEALAYLEKRGLMVPELVTRFKLGYADGSLLDLVTNGHREALKVLGILRPAGSEHLSGCITFPIFDVNDRVVSFYGRAIDPDTKVPHLYLSGKHKGVWNHKAAAVYADELILTESIIDGLSLVALGVANTQACYGANGFTDEHLELLRANRVKLVVIAFDADEAGAVAAAKLKERLLAEGFGVKVVASSQGKDWNEFLTFGGGLDSIRALIADTELVSSAEARAEGEGALTARREGGIWVFEFGDLTYRLVGVKDVFVQDLKVNVKVERDGGLASGVHASLGTGPSVAGAFYDKLDLYSSRARAAFAQNSGELFRVEPSRIGRDLVAMLERLEAERDKFFKVEPEAKLEFTARELAKSHEFLTGKNLLDELASDMTSMGYVGEESNKKLVMLAAVSRLLERPLSVYIQSGSSSGKSYLLETLRKLLPPDSVKALTSFSDQALNYLAEEDFQGKVFIIGEAVHNDVVEAQIRQMQSEGELSRLVTLKDPKTGELKSREVRHKVRMSFMMSSTALWINPENASRCLILHVDESAAQTEAVLVKQRERRTAEGRVEELRLVPEIIRKHQAAQIMLEPLPVFNPFAPHLRFPKSRPSMRRSQEQFLTLMDSVCLLRQKQKECVNHGDMEGIECDIEDYRIAYDLFTGGVLKPNANDLATGACALYGEIRTLARKLAKKQDLPATQTTFIQRDIREVTELGADSVKRYLRMLVEWEYVQVVSGKTHGTRFSYRLREDKDIEELDISVIPIPEKILELGKAGKTGEFPSFEK